MLEESVIYQDIYRKGERRGLEQGERKLAMHLLERKFGKLSQTLRGRIERLEVEQLEALCEALPDLQTKDDLTRWLKQYAPARRNGA